MIVPLLFAEIIASQIAAAEGWTLAKNDEQPFCFAERRLGKKMVAIHYNAIEERSIVLLVSAKGYPIKELTGSETHIIISNSPSEFKVLKGLRFAGIKKFGNGSEGLLFESEIDGYLERFPPGDRLSALNGTELVISVEAPSLSAAVAAMVTCSRNVKSELLESL